MQSNNTSPEAAAITEEVTVDIDSVTFAGKEYVKGKKIKCTKAQAEVLLKHGITNPEVKHV